MPENSWNASLEVDEDGHREVKATKPTQKYKQTTKLGENGHELFIW